MATLESPLTTTAFTGNQFAPQWDRSRERAAEPFEEPREQAFKISSGASAYRVVHQNNSLPTWVKPTISAFITIQNLADNWDSYGGKAINRDLIQKSLSTLALIMQTDTPAPSVVPMGDGGIQIEWHRKQQDLEIVFPAGDAPQFYYRNRSTATSDEGPVSDTKKLIHLLIDLA